MRSLHLHTCCCLFLFLSYSSKGQVQYVPLTPEQWVMQYLVGPGAQVSNIEYFGHEDQLGALLNLDTVGYGMPMVNAAAISNSWTTYLIPGNSDPDVPEYYGSSSPPAFSGPFHADDGDVFADLLSLSQEAMDILGWNYLDTNLFDVGMIEFDVLATSDTLSFEYMLTGGEIFRSVACIHGEGSLSYAGDCYFHDVFSVFVAGPGISGPFSCPPQYPDGSINIANVPGTNPLLPLTSESLNDSTYNEFWIPYWEMLQDSIDCEYTVDCADSLLFNEHGFTTVLNPKVGVTCGQVYHIRIAIADVFDHVYNYAALFNPIGGTENEGINPSVYFSFDQGGNPIYDVYEDCNPVWLNIVRSEQIALSEPDTVFLSSSGIAVEGIDFDILSEYIVIPAGDSVYSFPLPFTDDNVVEGSEGIIISCTEMHNDNQSCAISVSALIWDSANPILVDNTEVLVCSDSLLFAPEISGGYGQYTFLWQDNSTEETFVLIEPDENSEVFVIVDDVCSFQPDTVFFELVFFDPLVVDIPLDTLQYTCNTVLTVNANVSGGIGNYSYSWDPFASIADTDVYEYNTALGPQMVYLSVEDGCNSPVTDSIMIYTPSDPVMVYGGEDTLYTNCVGQVVVAPNITGGFGPYTNFYFIGQNLNIGNSITLTPTDTTFVVVMSYDMCGQTLITPVSVFPYSEPIVVSMPDTTNILCAGSTPVEPTVDGGFGNLIYQWYENNTLTSDADEFYEYVGLDSSVLSLTVTDECGEMGSDTTLIILDIEPLTLSLPDTVFTSCVNEIVITSLIQGGEEPFSYSWSINGQEQGNGAELNGLTLDADTLIELVATDQCGQEVSGSVYVSILNDPLMMDLQDTTVYCGENVVLTPLVQGGEGTLLYSWILDGIELGDQASLSYVFTSGINELSLMVSDQCGQINSDLIEVITEALPLDVELPGNMELTCGQVVDIIPEWIAGNSTLIYQWYYNGLLESESSELTAWNPGEDGELLLVVSDLCGGIDSAQVEIDIVPIQLEIDLPDQLTISCAGTLDLSFEAMGWTDQSTAVWSFQGAEIGTDIPLLIQDWVESGWITLLVSDPCAEEILDSCFVNVELTPLEGSPEDYYLCEPGLLEVQAEVIGGNGTLQYSWNGIVSDSPFISVDVSADMTLVWYVEDECSQTISDTSFIYLYDLSNEILWEDLGISGQFLPADTSCYGCQYFWNFDGSQYTSEDLGIMYPYPASSDFLVMLITQNEWCADTAYLYVSPPTSYYIPNSFTPNEDGLNDVFGMESIGLYNVEFTIYNRWGEVVFYTEDPGDRWTGNFMNGSYYCEDGAYVYHLKALDSSNQLIDKHGTVVLFR